MVTIFGVSWLPLTAINLLNDFYLQMGMWKHYYLFFFSAHAVAMSSTCYNPFLYAWLNENFRKEFKQVLPCWRNGSGYGASGADAGQGRRGRVGGYRSERTCNGNDTCQETLLPTSVVMPSGRTTATTDCTGLDLVVSTTLRLYCVIRALLFTAQGTMSFTVYRKWRFIINTICIMGGIGTLYFVVVYKQ